MNMEQLEGKWDQIKGQIKTKWGKITDSELTVIKGKKDLLVGKLREHYGYEKEQAERELSTFMKDCKCDSDDKNTKNNHKNDGGSKPEVVSNA